MKNIEIHKIKRLGLDNIQNTTNLNKDSINQDQSGGVAFSIIWYSDKERKNAIYEATLGDTLYYRIYCNGIPENTNLKLLMYDRNEFSKDTNLNKFQYGRVKNNKIENQIYFDMDYRDFIEKDGGDDIEIIWKVNYKGNIYEISFALRLKNDDYYVAIMEDLYVYTCNCGWIDKRHFKPTTEREEKFKVGAVRLWDQLKNQSGIKSKYANGYKVVYTQDAKIAGQYVGITNEYFIQYGLDPKIRERIAMAIMQEVSMEYEALQSYGKYIGNGSSSFEPADLVSNILSLYSVLRPNLTEKEIDSKCNKLKKEQSYKIYKDHPGMTFLTKYKNKKFTPLFFKNDICKKPVFPKEFQEIVPYPKDNRLTNSPDIKFRDWYAYQDGGELPMISV